MALVCRNAYAALPRRFIVRTFHAASRQQVVKPFLLADIGEGIREVQIIQWFVQPGARVNEWDKICEVQSDKASTEITARFPGVIKKLHYDADDMAVVGKALLDIDVDEKEVPPDVQSLPNADSAKSEESEPKEQSKEPAEKSVKEIKDRPEDKKPAKSQNKSPRDSENATLATPAVRHLTKEHGVDIADIEGTGKDGRVLKEDVNNHIAAQKSGSSSSTSRPASPTAKDETISLTPVQAQMLKTMTKSLNIPHFLYSDTVNLSSITSLRKLLNADVSKDNGIKLSTLPFFMKAISLAFSEYPLINGRLDAESGDKPKIILRGSHNFGFACDTPQGLLVPVIKDIQNMSVLEIAAEAQRLSALAREGKLSNTDFSGGTFTVSNVGSIGGGVVAPVIVEGQLSIVGIGRSKVVPVFDEDGSITSAEECTLSWSADHRVVDGATMARCAEVVRRFVESPGSMLARLR